MISTAVLLLSLTVYHEGRGEPQLCQGYIADTVINRVRNSDKSAKQVIKAKSQYQWLSLVRGKDLQAHYKRIQTKGQPADKKALEQSTKLANLVLSSEYVPLNKGQYFMTKRSKVPKYYGGYTTCGGHYFSHR